MWHYERTEENEPASPDVWRVFDDSDQSNEATVCELWSGEHDNEALAREISEAHNCAWQSLSVLPMPRETVLARGWGEKRAHYVYDLACYEKTRTGSRWVAQTDNDELWFEPVEWMALPQPVTPNV
jgi:hypothetical protein